MSTRSNGVDQLDADPVLPPLGSVGLLRWAWRQLTSMRVALILLFLLAVAAIPGSLLPQQGTDPLRVEQWIADNPGWGPTLRRLGFFDVYASPWFAAVYLLLFVSLIGCVLPRAATYWQQLRQPPPRAPRNLSRLEEFARQESALAPDAVIDRATTALRGWRLLRGEDADGGRWMSAEKGFLRELGNLAFHLALIGILVAVGVGGLMGWKGNVIVRVGQGFSNTLTQYDAWGGGRFVSPDALPPFSFTLDSFDVAFERGEAQRGAPRAFLSALTLQRTPDAAPEATSVDVNHPLDIDGARVYLVGHGYAPHIRITDPSGAVLFDDTVVFLPQDGSFTSTGVVKLPDATPQLGLQGLFLPTTTLDPELGPTSSFPAPDNPSLVLAAYTGDLGLDSGRPQSVYALDTAKTTRIGVRQLFPGESWALPNGQGTVAFVGVDRWASFQIAHDPGKELALLFAIIAITGLMLSLLIRRRRVWVRARSVDGVTVVESAGLRRTDAGDLAIDLDRIRDAIGGIDSTTDQRTNEERA